MKKVTRIVGLCAILALSVMSCKKNEEKALLSFKATINQLTSNDKTYIEYVPGQVPQYIVKWNKGDRARVFKKDGSFADFETQDEGATNIATFDQISSGDFPPSEYGYAVFYPAEFATKEGNKVKLTFPKDQVYKEEGGIETNTFPMAAAGPDFTFNFSSPCGILKVPLYSENGSEITVKKIVLQDNNNLNPIAGTLKVKLDQFKVEGYNYEDLEIDYLDIFSFFMSDQGKTITLNCPEGGVTLSTDSSEATDFYFVVPTYPEKYLKDPYNRPQVFEEGFNITMYDMNDEPIMTQRTPASSKTDYTMKAQTILRMAPLEVSYQNN